jgi:hypothetical protein
MRRTKILTAVAFSILLAPPAFPVADRVDVPAASARAAIAALPAARLGPDPGPAVRLRIEGVTDVTTGERVDLALERFEVATPDARLIVRDEYGERSEPLPHGVYLRGYDVARPEALVFLALHDDELRGLIVDGEGVRMLGFTTDAARVAGRLEARRADPSELAREKRPFECAVDRLRAGAPDAEIARALGGTAPRRRPYAGSPLELAPDGVLRTVIYAVETDFEYYQLFGNAAVAGTYALDLMAFISTLYVTDVDTAILVNTVTIHTAVGDPWAQTSPLCSLLEFGKYWNDNRDNVERTAAVMLSGKSNGGGVAWLGVLCSGDFNFSNAGCSVGPSPSNYGGAYAYVGDIDGIFNVNNPTLVIWDLVATAHEIGHNFNSPHTHCYFSVDATDQIDRCFVQEKLDLQGDPDTCIGAGNTARWDNSGCACAGSAATYPGIGTTTGGAAGQAGGTIMSYCHLLGGGFTNVALNFGLGHARGFQASRVSNRMKSHAASNNSCTGYGIFLDGFASGNTSRWDSDTP